VPLQIIFVTLVEMTLCVREECIGPLHHRRAVRLEARTGGQLDCGGRARLPVSRIQRLVPGFYRKRRELDKWQNIEVRINRRASQDASLDLTPQCR
jgi:hypothetical protein